jgi:hypothetical protein
VSATRAVEIDEVHPVCTRGREACCKCKWITGALDDIVVGTTVETDSLLAEHVDGWDHLERAAEPGREFFTRQHAAMLT